MSYELLQDMFYAAPELWYILGAAFAALLAFLMYNGVKILKLRQKNYFLNRDRERYAETLYASKDGYFAFIYPDEKVNDPRKTIKERCSRRLAVILNLEKGTNSSFEDVLKTLYKDDAKKLVKYVSLLMDDGVSFEEEFVLKSNGKHINLTGSRINGIDGNIYCDMIWFRDVSFESNRISDLEQEKEASQEKVRQLRDLIDNIPYPVWLRDENLKPVLVNRKYAEFVPEAGPEEIVARGLEIQGINGESISTNLALVAHTANRVKKETVSLVKNGERHSFEVIETPFHAGQSLDKICTAGALIEVTELDELKRNLKLHQNAHLEILGALGTALTVSGFPFTIRPLPLFGDWKTSGWKAIRHMLRFWTLSVKKGCCRKFLIFVCIKTMSKRTFRRLSNRRKICCICRTAELSGGYGRRIRWAVWCLPLKTYPTVWRRGGHIIPCCRCSRRFWTICLIRFSSLVLTAV